MVPSQHSSVQTCSMVHHGPKTNLFFLAFISPFTRAPNEHNHTHERFASSILPSNTSTSQTHFQTMNNIQCFRFCIPDQVSTNGAPSPNPHSPGNSTANWACTLTKLGDDTVRVALRPPPSLCRTEDENLASGQRHCSSIQILSTTLEVLTAKNMSRFDFSKRGIEWVECRFSLHNIGL